MRFRSVGQALQNTGPTYTTECRFHLFAGSLGSSMSPHLWIAHLDLTFATFRHLDLLQSNVRFSMESYSFHLGRFHAKSALKSARSHGSKQAILESKEKNADSFRLVMYSLLYDTRKSISPGSCGARRFSRVSVVNPTAGYFFILVNRSGHFPITSFRVRAKRSWQFEPVYCFGVDALLGKLILHLLDGAGQENAHFTKM